MHFLRIWSAQGDGEEITFQETCTNSPEIVRALHRWGGYQKNPLYRSDLPTEYRGGVVGKRWNPKYLWMPTDKGLGMGHIFELFNSIYGNDFYIY